MGKVLEAVALLFVVSRATVRTVKNKLGRCLTTRNDGVSTGSSRILVDAMGYFSKDKRLDDPGETSATLIRKAKIDEIKAKEGKTTFRVQKRAFENEMGLYPGRCHVTLQREPLLREVSIWDFWIP